MRRKQNFAFKSDTAVSLSLLPSYFAFLASFFFYLARHLVAFILVGRAVRKAFRILGLGEGKVGGQWNKIFMEIYSVLD